MKVPRELHFSHNNILRRVILLDGTSQGRIGHCNLCCGPLQGQDFYTTDPPEFSIHVSCALQGMKPYELRASSRDVRVPPPPHPPTYFQPNYSPHYFSHSYPPVNHAYSYYSSPPHPPPHPPAYFQPNYSPHYFSHFYPPVNHAYSYHWLPPHPPLPHYAHYGTALAPHFYQEHGNAHNAAAGSLVRPVINAFLEALFGFGFQSMIN